MKTARCWKCNFTLRLPDHKEAPAKCPLCNYGSSKADQDAFYLKIAKAKKWAMLKADWFGLKGWLTGAWSWLLASQREINDTRWAFKNINKMLDKKLIVKPEQFGKIIDDNGSESITVDMGKVTSTGVVTNWLCPQCKSPLKNYVPMPGVVFIDEVGTERCEICRAIRSGKVEHCGYHGPQ